MRFHRTVDLIEGNNMVLFLMKAFKENAIVVAKIDFKLSKNKVKLTIKKRSLGALGY